MQAGAAAQQQQQYVMEQQQMTSRMPPGNGHNVERPAMMPQVDKFFHWSC